MAKQFNILATDNDLRSLDSMLRDFGDTDLLSDEPTEDLQGLLPLAGLAIPVEKAGKSSLFCYLAPCNLPTKICIELESDVKVHINERLSNLVEFWRPFFDGYILRPGRLYVHDRKMVGNELQLKDPAFCDWAKKTMASIRKSLQRDPVTGVYLGADAATLIASGRITVESVL